MAAGPSLEIKLIQFQVLYDIVGHCRTIERIPNQDPMDIF